MNRFTKTKTIFMTVLIFALGIHGVNQENLAAAKSKVKLNKGKVTLIVGQKTKLKLKNYKKKIKWSSSKKKVATVNKKGVVTAKKKGAAKITAKAGKKQYICRITVKEKKKNISEKTGSTPTAEQKEKRDDVPSVTASATPSVTAGATPFENVSVMPSADPSATASSEEITAEVPKFLNFKTYDGKDIQTEEPEAAAVRLLHHTGVVAGTETARLAVLADEAEGNNWINKDDILLLKLSYENKKRDSIVEIVLNDSDYGKKQIYTTAASVNKILSSDTYYDDEKDSYITDVLLQMPNTKSHTERTIEIVETSFLRETMGIKGYADLSSARRTRVDFSVAEEPIPSYSVYFNFVENEDNGYTLVSLSTDFTQPDTLYIPPEFNGKAVNKIGDTAFEKARIKKLIIPESVSEIGNNMTNATASLLKEIEMKGAAPDLGSLALDSKQLEGGCRIIVPEECAYEYRFVSYWKVMYGPLIFFRTEAGEYRSLSESVLYPLPSHIEDFPKITIDAGNETILTRLIHNVSSYYRDIVWDHEQHSVSYTADSPDEWMTNGGLSLYLDTVKREKVDISEYNYIKLDVETEEEVMVKLLTTEEHAWDYAWQGEEARDSEVVDFKPGRRTIYFDISNVNESVLSILVNANKKDADIKLYGIEFVKR